MDNNLHLHVVERNGRQRAVCGTCLKSIHLSATYICPNEGCWHSAPVDKRPRFPPLPPTGFVAVDAASPGRRKGEELVAIVGARSGGKSRLMEDSLITDMMVVHIQLTDKGLDELATRQMQLILDYMRERP